MGSNATDLQTHRHSQSENEWKDMRELRNSILLLATLVATATYAAGFSPPGGVWQETAGRLPGDPIIRSTQYVRYLMFFYCNATAFASSLMVVVLIIFLPAVRLITMSRWHGMLGRQEKPRVTVIPLGLVTLLGLLSLIGAYATGTFRDVFTAVFTSLLVGAVFTYLLLVYFGDKRSNSGAAWSPDPDPDHEREERRNRQVLIQLATFALTVTYGGGLSTPGGFWDSTDGGNRPGDSILKGARLTVFFVCNTMAFVASLLMVLVLLSKIRRIMAAYAGSILMLLGLLGSYLAGSCRETDTSIYIASLIGAIVAYIVFLVVFSSLFGAWARNSNLWVQIQYSRRAVLRRLVSAPEQTQDDPRKEREMRAVSITVQYLATLALTITYVAGLHPPGGLWQDDGDHHKAGDPILQTTNLGRYNAFFYCNSVAFVASLVCMILVQLKPLLKHRALEQAMILDLLGLVGSYAFGSCRAETTTVYTMGIGGAALVYVVLHVVLLDDREGLELRGPGHDREGLELSIKNLLLDRLGGGFFLLAIFVATITYQAGLTPPGGFLLKDDESGNRAGDPVLLHNYPRRYRIFFYCNSTSFMVSIAVIILLVNPKLYRPAMQTHALSVCTAVSFFCLLAAFAAGTTQHLKTSIYTLVSLAVVFCSAVLLILLFLLGPSRTSSSATAQHQVEDEATRAPPNDTVATKLIAYRHTKLVYMMTVGILVASVTYQAGLDPPGGSWQRSNDGHDAGSPVMHDNRRQRYLLFFFSNSTSFVASISLMFLLLPWMYIVLKKRVLVIMNTMLMLGFLGLLGAYATGSNREWRTSVHVIAIFFSVLAYFGVLLVLSLFPPKGGDQPSAQVPQELDADS